MSDRLETRETDAMYQALKRRNKKTTIKYNERTEKTISQIYKRKYIQEIFRTKVVRRVRLGFDLEPLVEEDFVEFKLITGNIYVHIWITITKYRSYGKQEMG